MKVFVPKNDPNTLPPLQGQGGSIFQKEPEENGRTVADWIREYWLYLAGGIVVILLLWGVTALWSGWVGWLGSTSWGQVSEIEVVGNRRVTDQEIIRASGVDIGEDMMTLPLDSVAIRMLKLPAIKAARVIRKIPGRLVVYIEERKPMALLPTNHIKFVDDSAKVFLYSAQDGVVDLPVITKEKEVKNFRFEEAVALVAAIRDSCPNLYEHLGEVSIGSTGNWLKLRNNASPIWIYPGNVSGLKQLDAFLKKEGNNLPVDITYIDVRFSGMIVVGSD